MFDLLPFIIAGLATGSVYGLASTGIVLTYKTSGILNFAHGSVAAVAVFIYYPLADIVGMPWPLAALIALVVAGPGCGVLFELVARRLADSSQAQKITVTIGIYVIVIAAGNILYGPDPLAVQPHLSTDTFQVGGVFIGWDQLITALIAVVLSAGLFVFFRYSQLGVTMRAVVDDPTLVGMSGVSPVRVRRVAWMIGNTFAALSGLLLAPSIGLSATLLTLLVVQALGAAAIGYLSNIPLTFLGGLVIGVISSISTKYAVTEPALQGLPPSLPFIVLFIVLIVMPKRRLMSRRFVVETPFPDAWHAPIRVRALFAVIAVVVLACLPLLAPRMTVVFSTSVIAVLMFISLGLLIRIAGQVSLCQYAFAAIGAAAMAHFSTSLGLPWLVSILLAGLVAIPVGAVIAIPALRLSGVFLALATLGLGLFVETLLFRTPLMFGESSVGVSVARPEGAVGGLSLGSDIGYYYVVLAFVVICALLVEILSGSRLGRLLKGVRDSPVAMSTSGLSVRTSIVIVFCISTSLAAMAGGLTASLVEVASGDLFPSFSSLALIVLVMIIPFGGPWYAVVGAVSSQVIPALLSGDHVFDYLNILFGIGAVLSVYQLQNYHGMPHAVRRVAERIDRLLGGPAGATQSAGPVPEESLAPPSEPDHLAHTRASRATTGAGGGLRITDLTIRYGGSTAVSSLSMVVAPGRITGLIGPNGAGKTSTFNACSGLVRPESGTVELDGADIGRRAVASRARLGLGRSFQRVELCNSLTVAQNIAFGYECSRIGMNPFRQVFAGRRTKAAAAAAVRDAAAITGLTSVLGVRASDISTGQRRLVELARLIAGDYEIILLDEPSSGLDGIETQRFGEIVQRLVAERRVGVLLVEHDIALVKRICDDVYVLDFGNLIYEGPAESMLSSEAVRSAYLGTFEVAATPAELAPAQEEGAVT